MTTKNPSRPRKPATKKPKADATAPQGPRNPSLPPLLQVMDTTLPDGTIVVQYVFTVPCNDEFLEVMAKNFMARLTQKRTGLTVPKLVIPGAKG